MKRSGFSLFETVAGLGFLSLLAVLSFQIFAWSSGMFSLTNARLELQGEIRRINGAVRRDMLESAFVSVSTKYISIPITLPAGSTNPADTKMCARDPISFSSMIDPTSPNSYTVDNGFSLFNCTTIYYPYTSPTDPYDCKLYRYKVSWDDPVTSVSGTTLQSPLAGFGLPDTRYDWPNPTKIIPAFGVHCYSNRIRCFQIKPNPGDQTLQLEVTLQGPIGRTTMGQKSTAEIVESSVLLKCENTWPKL